MSRVDWITWKTDPKEIINPNIIEENINDYFKQYNTYMNPVVYEQIKYEVNNGGLDSNSLSIQGISPAHEMAVEIINRIDEIKEEVEKLKNKIRDNAEEQKEIEKQQLVEAIETKIDEETKLLNNVETNPLTQQHIENIGGVPSDVVEILNARINRLNERLEMAKSL